MVNSNASTLKKLPFIGETPNGQYRGKHSYCEPVTTTEQREIGLVGYTQASGNRQHEDIVYPIWEHIAVHEQGSENGQSVANFVEYKWLEEQQK